MNSQFCFNLGARDADAIIAASEECAAMYPEPLRTHIQIAFIKGALASQQINTQSHKEIIEDLIGKLKQ